MGKLILVRHGETDKNLGNSLHSSDDPETLNATGRSQIETTAKKLKEYSPENIYSSKEKRAVESSGLISHILQIPTKEVKGMQERNWGIFSGKPWEEVKKVLDPMTLEERYEYTPPQGESWRTFETRLIKAINRILSEAGDKSVVVVTHGGAIRALMPYLLNVPKEESFKYDPDNASLNIFNVDKNKFKCVTINDTSHLKKV